MDIKRDPAILKKKKIRRGILGGLAVVAVIVISVAVSRLEPAAPSVERSTLWYGKVQRGNMTREVRGAGTLVPEDIRWIPATAPGRVERILLQPGAQVDVGTAILELDNPDLRSQMENAEMDWKTAQAQLENQIATAKTTRLQQENNVANAQADFDFAQADLKANQTLQQQGLVAELTIQQKVAAVARARNQLELAKRQLQAAVETEQSTLAPARATVDQNKTRFDQLARQVSELTVRSTMKGQLQVVNVEVGQQMGTGAQLVRVSDPTQLKAQIRIPETQTRDLAIGLTAMIDTRNGSPVRGHVDRIDPASEGGTVGVDVILDEELPANARPAMSVDGVVQLQVLTDILFVESPAYGQENSTVLLFKVDPQTSMAHRVPVKIGVRSVQYVEVLEGLKEGDEVVLSDMGQWDAWDRLQLK
jgi:HlyD family secretion protein